MSHEIEYLDGRHSFAYAGDPTWHGLGTKVPSDLTPQQILEAAGLDWNVEKVPSWINYNGEQKPTGTQALVRDTDGSILSMISDDWEPLQNHEAFDFFHDFVMAGNLSMETAGSLKKGQIVFALAKVQNRFEVFEGDVTESYILFTNPHKYGQSITVMTTATRVVCNNTLTFALNNTSQQKVRVNHRNKFDADYVKNTMGLANQKFQEFRELNEFLASRKATDEKISEFLSEVFPSNSKKELSRPARVVRDIIPQQPGAEYGEGSWYQVLNGVTFATNHLLSKNPDTRTSSLFYGSNQKRNLHALNLAVEYAEKEGAL